MSQNGWTVSELTKETSSKTNKMRTVITLAVGFWLGRTIYINYDKDTAKKKEEAIKNRLKNVLSEYGLSKSEVKETTAEIIGDNA